MMNLFSLAGKNIWVVGGAGYLGQSVVKALDELGAKIVCIDMDEKAQKFAESAGLKNVWPVSFNINQTSEIPALVNQLTEKHGIPDGLVNLAFGSTAKTLEQLTAEDFDQVNHAAITSTFVLAREVASHMLIRGRGSIVLFASMYGVVSPNDELYHPPMNKNPIEYGVGKAGVIQMTKYLAVHWGEKGVRVNCISPGPFPNPSVQQSHPDFINRLAQKSPMGRVGVAEEIAGPVAFLLSDSSSYVTGHNLVVDGGWTSW